MKFICNLCNLVIHDSNDLEMMRLVEEKFIVWHNIGGSTQSQLMIFQNKRAKIRRFFYISYEINYLSILHILIQGIVLHC